jgi:hypothetical protein
VVDVVDATVEVVVEAVAASSAVSPLSSEHDGVMSTTARRPASVAIRR